VRNDHGGRFGRFPSDTQGFLEGRSRRWYRHARWWKRRCGLFAVIGITRTALKHTELAGRTIERGTMIIISLIVAYLYALLSVAGILSKMQFE
jgi:hypothetical protein